jgi:hypothetical protein
MRRNSGGKTSPFFAAALRIFARKMKLNVSEKMAVGAALYVTVVFLIIAGSSARVGGQDNPGEIALEEARAREAASEGPAGSPERVIDTDRGKGKASGKKAHDTTHSDATGDAAVLNRTSRETGVPVATLLAEKSSTELGYGELEIANLLAKASGQRFDRIVAKFKAGEDWEKIAHDMGLKLGKIVSAAHRPSSKNEGKHLGQTNSESTSKPSSGGANSSPSFTIAPRP